MLSMLILLGVIMAYGRRWVYCIAQRPPSHTRTMLEKRDPTFRSIGSSETWESPEDSEDSNAILEDFKVDNPSLPHVDCWGTSFPTIIRLLTSLESTSW
jgi:hypothetical protein